MVIFTVYLQCKKKNSAFKFWDLQVPSGIKGYFGIPKKAAKWRIKFLPGPRSPTVFRLSLVLYLILSVEIYQNVLSSIFAFSLNALCKYCMLQVFIIACKISLIFLHSIYIVDMITENP